MLSIKKTIMSTLVIAPALFSFSTGVSAAELTGCAAKKQEITRQLEYARTHNNQHRVNGLTTALAEVEAHCTDASLQKERQQKVAEKQEKVNERQAELKEAQSSGRSDKVAKKQQKLDEAKEELAAAQAELQR